MALAALLHPTPAVGGEPFAVAEPLIPELEGFDRGWYAGPVGWTDANGDGELCVALRCALLRGAGRALLRGRRRRARLGAGGGAGRDRGQAAGAAAGARGLTPRSALAAPTVRSRSHSHRLPVRWRSTDDARAPRHRPPPPPPRREDTRTRLLRAGVEVLEAGGYAAASVAAIAERAGVATGTLYRHFPSKADLFVELFRAIGDAELEAMQEAAAAPARQPRSSTR